jgi:hypothetical protein
MIMLLNAVQVINKNNVKLILLSIECAERKEHSKVSKRTPLSPNGCLLPCCTRENMIISTNDAIKFLGWENLSLENHFINHCGNEQGFDEILADVFETGIPFHACRHQLALYFKRKNYISLHFYLSSQRDNGDRGVAVIANGYTTAIANIHLKER